MVNPKSEFRPKEDIMKYYLEEFIKKGKKWILINPPSLGESNDVESRKLSINLGILHIASSLVDVGVEIEILDWQTIKTIEELEIQLKALPDGDVYGISNNFFRAYQATLHICKFISRRKPMSRILVGGMHGGWLKDRNAFPEEIEVIKGNFVRTIMKRCPEQILNRYDLWPDVASAMPILEVDQGCKQTCLYCSRPRSTYRPLNLLQEEFKWVQKHWQSPDLIWASYNFGENYEHDYEVFSLIRNAGYRFATQARPDILVRNGFKYLQEAKKSGLKVLSIGMESINENALKFHHKTNNAELWKSSVTKVLTWCSQLEIEVKLNVIIFNGEQKNDLAKLDNFLHRLQINLGLKFSVTAGPLMVFPGTPLAKKSPKLATLKPEEDFYFKNRYVYPAHISDEISFYDALTYCQQLEKKYPYLPLDAL